jgi:hypothetical protein
VSIQNSELALLEARLKQAEKLLEESKRRLAGRPQNPTNSDSSGRSVPDYKPNPSFSATAGPPKKTEQPEGTGDAEVSARNSAEAERAAKGHAHKMSGVYEMRPPPPPPSVPTSI